MHLYFEMCHHCGSMQTHGNHEGSLLGLCWNCGRPVKDTDESPSLWDDILHLCLISAGAILIGALIYMVLSLASEAFR